MTNQTQVQHTPTPWFINGPNHIGHISVASERDGAVAEMVWHHVEGRRFPVEANADFIVRAVNSHDDLLAALEEARAFLVALRLTFMHETTAEDTHAIVESMDELGPRLDRLIFRARGED
jgi:cysteine sulfinate desulfinase/cysteine desulfurase-like protein